jgi:hypothetical protein
MIKSEIVIDEWNASYFDNVYSDESENKRKGSSNRKVQIPTDIFINKMITAKKTNSLTNTILPPNCRYALDIGTYKLFIIEEPPQMRTIFLDYDMSGTIASLKASGNLKKFGYENWFKENKKPYKFYLAFPYIIYTIVLNSSNQYVRLRPYTRVTPLSSFGDYTCKIPLMNINSDQTLCMGSFSKTVNTKTPTTAVGSIIKTFWENIFNQDYIYNVQAYNDIPFVCDYLTWQYYSQQDPMFIYNVEWVPYKTIGFEINRFESSYTHDGHDGSLQSLVNKVFYKSTPTSSSDSKTKRKLYDNIADSINIDRIPIFVNDSFMLKNKRYFVRTFMSTKLSTNITHVQLQDSDKKLKTYRLTQRFKDKLRKSIMEERFIQSTTLSNGASVKQGSIIRSINVHGNKVYNKIDYMRYGLDGKIEARIKGSLTALEDMKDIKVMNMDKININGNNLIKGKEYTILFNHSHYYRNSSSPIKILRKLKLNDIDISSSGKILTKFQNSKTEKAFSINLEDLEKRIVNAKKFEKLPCICRLGTSMIYNSAIKIHPDMPNYLFTEDVNCSLPSYNPTMETIFDSKEHLFIESFDMNLSFKIGDKVVVSDWLNPGEMLKVKTIMGFKTINNRKLNVLLEDQHGNKSEHTYLKKSLSNFTVNVGTLRHIEKEYKGITSGTKIKANKAGISNFPMKDTNIIIGFLTDTGGDIPLVLCSNGTTLWGDDLIENFNLTTMRNKKWKSLKHVPIIDQRYFKFQPGDMTTVPYNRNHFVQNLITIQFKGERLVCQYLTEEQAINPSYSGYFVPEIKPIVDRIGFLNPRYSQKQLQTQKFVTAYPNFHGMYNFNPDIRMKYYADERRFTNVSDLPV